MIAPEFLDLEEVLEIHALQLDEFGGIAGVRDRGLLESAVEQARATAFGELLHADLFEMAAAYLFHIVKHHAFLDGNKRTALVTALENSANDGLYRDACAVFNSRRLHPRTPGESWGFRGLWGSGP
jgi:death on curing protein